MPAGRRHRRLDCDSRRGNRGRSTGQHRASASETMKALDADGIHVKAPDNVF